MANSPRFGGLELNCSEPVEKVDVEGCSWTMWLRRLLMVRIESGDSSGEASYFVTT